MGDVLINDAIATMTCFASCVFPEERSPLSVLSCPDDRVINSVTSVFTTGFDTLTLSHVSTYSPIGFAIRTTTSCKKSLSSGPKGNVVSGV